MNRRCLVLTIGLIGVGSIRASGQAQAPTGKGSPANPLSVCEILKRPLQYDGKIVTVRDHAAGGDEGAALVGKECAGIFATEGYVWPSAISLADPTWHGRLRRPDFNFDTESQRRVDTQWSRHLKSVPPDCLLYTYTGLFETRIDWSAAKVVYPNGKWKFLGFGHLNGSPGQLLLRSADDVEVDLSCGPLKTEQ